MAHTPLPLQIAASLKTLSGDDLKVMVLLCDQTFNRDRSQLTLEQIESGSAIPRHALKPSLMRLMRRAWIIQDGPFYRLSLSPNLSSASPTDSGSQVVQQVAHHANSPQPIAAYAPELGIRPPRVRANLLYPDGPWLTETGFLDEAFVRDRAQVWQKGDHYQAKAFGAMAIEDVMGLVCKHYAKYENHGNLEIDWHSYCLKNQRYLNNVKTRLDAGAEITLSEQEQVIAKFPLLQQSIEPVYATASPPALTSAETFPQPEALVKPEPLLPTNSSTNRTGMKMEIDRIPAATVLPEMVSKRLKLLSQSRSMPDRKSLDSREIKAMSRLDRLNLWVQDPILRTEAEREARSAGYAIEYNAIGIATRITEIDDYEDF